MSFPREIADEALVACARRCCICRKFCGTRMQLHHIIQEADGGSNTLDNCIPLCLDCHEEVGSYNPKHPIGRKFSSDELKQHRDIWFDFVRRHPERLNNSTEAFFLRLHQGKHEVPLSDAAKQLLVEASKSVDGFVGKHYSSDAGEIISTHGPNKDFMGDLRDKRIRALWLDAFNELVTGHFFEPLPSHLGFFRVTHLGYQRADSLKSKT